MLATIQARMLVIFVSFAVLLGGVLGASFMVLSRQADDGVVINLAGRQRMLTQKMSKEALMLANSAALGMTADIDGQRDQLRQTMRVFGATLDALRNGGPAPLNLDMDKVRELPPAADAALAKQLQEVDALWKPFKASLEGVVASRGNSGSDLTGVKQSNLPLLAAMNKAVGMMQHASEERVSALYMVQGVAVALGLLLMGVGAWVARTTISGPITELAESARRMSTGNLDVAFQPKGATEVRDLAESFDRMRASMIATMNSGVMDSAVGDDF